MDKGCLRVGVDFGETGNYLFCFFFFGHVFIIPHYCTFST